jgi:chromosome segregation ATPase
MSSPPTAFVTEAEVFAAASALTDDGMYPSVLAVRRRLGNRGSSTTISKHLKGWRDGPGKEALARVIAPVDGGPSDPEIDALLQLHPRVVDKLRAQVEGRFRAQITALEQTLAAVRDEADAQAQATAEALTGRESAEARVTSAVDQVGSLVAELAAVRQQHAIDGAAATAAQQAAIERIATLERELGTTQGARRILEGVLGERDHQLAQLRSDLAVAQGTLREAERRIDTDLAQLAALREAHASASAEITDLRSRLDDARQVVATRTSERDQLVARVATVERAAPTATALTQAVDRLAGQVAHHQQRLIATTLRVGRQRRRP